MTNQFAFINTTGAATADGRVVREREIQQA
jgi:hypothetical protein